MTAWALYDALLDQIPPDLVVASAVTGTCSLITTTCGRAGLGVAVVPTEPRVCEELAGQTLREVARLVTSWDLEVAALGTAALGAWFNQRERLAPYANPLCGDRSTFSLHAGRVSGRKVAVIGHFPDLYEHLTDCDLVILERDPQEGDLPDSACEYVLPGRDLVYITGTALTNKTLPRLLELSANAEVFIVGPSTQLAPEVLSGSVAGLGGAIVTDSAACAEGILGDSSVRGLLPSFEHYHVVL